MRLVWLTALRLCGVVAVGVSPGGIGDAAICASLETTSLSRGCSAVGTNDPAGMYESCANPGGNSTAAVGVDVPSGCVAGIGVPIVASTA